MRAALFVLFIALLKIAPAQAQTITAANVQMEWKVVNRFRLFRDSKTFLEHENAWRQYKIHVDGAAPDAATKQRLIETTSVVGTEHVLNDRYIPFTRHLRTKYDPMGWAARQVDDTCWSPKDRTYSACGSAEAYVSPPPTKSRSG